MKINKEEIDRLIKMTDRDLWNEITAMAKKRGYNLPQETPSHENIEKIRNALSGIEKITLSDAAKIINSIKKYK